MREIVLSIYKAMRSLLWIGHVEKKQLVFSEQVGLGHVQRTKVGFGENVVQNVPWVKYYNWKPLFVESSRTGSVEVELVK